jgi:4-amino-4-deoxy-L-arabinose transferase-like glycosyltransferase
VTGAARRHVPLLVLLGLPVFFLGLGSYSVVNGDEGLYHTVAAGMLERGDWFTLDFHGEHRVYDTFMNAPTHYWARALLIAAIGDNLWSMRLLSATFGLLTVLVAWRLARDVARSVAPGREDAAGLLAGLVQLTTYHFVYLHGARTGELDTILAFLVATAAWLLLRGLRDGTGFVGHHVCLALVCTVKLPAVIVPVLGALAVFALTPAARPHFRRYARTGLAIVPLGLAWHAFQAAVLWDELRDVAGRMGDAARGEGADKVTGTPVENAAWYARRLLFGAFPWSVAMVPAVLAATRDAVRGGAGDARLAARVLLLGLAAVLVFFAFVGQRYPWYLQPAYPFLAVATGLWLARLGARAGALSVAAVAATLALVLWIRVPFDLEPFVQRAPLVPMEPAWRRPGGVPLPLGVGATVAAIAGVLFLARALSRTRPAAFARSLAGLATLALLSCAAWRVGYPLASLEHTSELERLFDEVEARRRAGDRRIYPVRIPEDQGYLKISTYFGRDYRLARERGPDGPVVFVLGEKRDRPPGSADR